ncbi:MAG: DNA polymerase II large subunit, partial [Candidatus Hermodarchaeota archaeon]
MVEMSKETAAYFSRLQKSVDECYEIAEKARQKGLDPEIFVESPQAKDLAGRVEKLVGPKGVADLIRILKSQGKSEDEIVFQVVSDILSKKIGNIDSLEERVERSIRVGLAIKTMGVVSAPLEGISKILIREDQHHNKYLSLYFAGPIRAAGGTTAALCILIADYVRKKSNIPKYDATEGEIGRYVEEVKLYDRRVHLQYPSSNDEIRFAVEHLPVEINGDSTEDEEVSAFRNLPRIETNKIRGGACLVLNDGILLKAPKLLKIAKSMNLEGWDWLGKLKEIAQKGEKKANTNISNTAKKSFIPPNSKYVSDIIAGRPVFSHPSKIGGHRIRYGRSRNTGLAAAGLHPVTMTLLDNFIAIGTQLRIERPGKSTSICPVSSIEPPIVKLKDGTVTKITNLKMARDCFQNIEEILFLGDILFGFGEFSENNHRLVPSGYVEEWWALELEEAINIKQKTNLELIKYIQDPFNNIPSPTEAIRIAKEYSIPLHPEYTDFWGNLTGKELILLREAMVSAYSEESHKIGLKVTQELKEVLEKAFISHTISDDNILLDDSRTTIFTS